MATSSPTPSTPAPEGATSNRAELVAKAVNALDEQFRATGLASTLAIRQELIDLHDDITALEDRLGSKR